MNVWKVKNTIVRNINGLVGNGHNYIASQPQELLKLNLWSSFGQSSLYTVYLWEDPFEGVDESDIK